MSAKKFYETSEFKKTQKEWAKKLKDSGFNDTDPGDDNTVRPQEFTIPASFKNKSTKLTNTLQVQESYKEDRPQLLEYSDFIEQGGLDQYQYHQAILREYEFKRPVDKAIFEMFAEGVTEREIRDALPGLGFKTITREAVHYIIERVLVGFRKV